MTLCGCLSIAWCQQTLPHALDAPLTKLKVTLF